MNGNVAMMFLLIALIAGSCAHAEEWVITKDNGSYRINGCKLMGSGRLADATGVIARNLTRQELDEIGTAIDRYELGHASLYASPAVAGSTQNSATEEHPLPATPAPIFTPPVASPNGGPDWPEGYPKSEYNLVHKDEIVAQEAEKYRMANWQPSYAREGLLPLFLLAGILVGIIDRSPWVSAVSACLWLGLILIECRLYGDKVLGTFLAFSMINLFVAFCFFVFSYLCLGGAKIFSYAFPPEPPRREDGQRRERRSPAHRHGSRRHGTYRK